MTCYSAAGKMCRTLVLRVTCSRERDPLDRDVILKNQEVKDKYSDLLMLCPTSSLSSHKEAQPTITHGLLVRHKYPNRNAVLRQLHFTARLMLIFKLCCVQSQCILPQSELLLLLSGHVSPRAAVEI